MRSRLKDGYAAFKGQCASGTVALEKCEAFAQDRCEKFGVVFGDAQRRFEAEDVVMDADFAQEEVAISDRKV